MNLHFHFRSTRTDSTCSRRPKAVRLLGATAVAALGLLALSTGCDGTTTEPDPGDPGTEPIACGAAELYSAVHDQCSAMDAEAVGDENGHCYCMLGYAWNGTECVSLGDCACQGADCDKLAETIEECEADHEGCTEPPPSLQCGDSTMYSLVHDECAPMDAVAAGDENGHCNCWLGYAWDGTECVGLGDCVCEGADCDKLTMDLEECQAAHASCEAPSGTPIHCGDSTLYSLVHDECAAMDATAVGDQYGHCDCMLGYAWNGTECVGLGDCACEGADCDKLTMDLEECEAAHESCG